MYLEVNNPDAAYHYTWYIDNTQIGTGTAGIYTTVPSAGKIVVRLRAVPNASGCAQEALSVETVDATPAPIPPVINVNSGNVLCGGQATLTASGSDGAFQWYKDGSVIPGQTAQSLMITETGSYSATTASTAPACVSQLSAPKSIAASDFASVNWVNHPDTANEGTVKTYSVDVDYPIGAVYSWEIIHKTGSSGVITNGQGTPSVTVSFPESGTDTVCCAVTTACGTVLNSPLKQEIVISANCADAQITSHQNSNSSVKIGQTANLPVLSVTATGNPLTYQWYKGASGSADSPISGAETSSYTVPSGDIGSTAPATLSYWCRVSSETCNHEDSRTFTVSVTANSADIPSGSGIFTGRQCLDIARGNDGNGCGDLANRQNKYKTDFTLTSEQGYPASAPYSGVQIYTFTADGNISNVRFDYTETVGSSIIDSIVPKADYSGNILSGNTCKAVIYYNPELNNTLEGMTRTTAYKARLYAIYNDKPAGSSGTDKKLELNISLQDCACCDGLLLENGAFDYANGTSGAWAAGKTTLVGSKPYQQDNTDIILNTGMSGSYNDAKYKNSFLPYFKTQSSGALCWYKRDARDGGSISINGWANAVNKCATGAYADGDATAGWYLPNARELDYLYRNLPDGRLGDVKVGSAAIFGGSTDAEPIAVSRYWSSTERNSDDIYFYSFNDGYRNIANKGHYGYTRCVRRF
jgi:hypothetical protein